MLSEEVQDRFVERVWRLVAHEVSHAGDDEQAAAGDARVEQFKDPP
jgi:hypothetical protein